MSAGDQLGSQFNPQPYFTKGGQGKFFQDPKPVEQHRYQRGYTPERMRDVRGSMLDVQSTGEGHFGGPAGVHRVYQTIARSTTPTHEFNETPVETAWKKSRGGVPEGTSIDPSDSWSLHINTGVTGNISGDKRIASGGYQSGGTWDRGQIQISARQHDTEEHAGQTLLHELGHYRSDKVVNTGHHEGYLKYPSSTGREEAFADDNMVSRWRPDPRDVRRGTSNPKGPSYESPISFHSGMGGQKAWGPYLTARTTLPKDEKRSIRAVGHRRVTNRERYAETEFTNPFGEHHVMTNPDQFGNAEWVKQPSLFPSVHAKGTDYEDWPAAKP